MLIKFTMASQRYDPDPAAKAAAASVLASKLGADSGLKFNLGDETKVDPASGKSRDVELAQSKGLRNRHNRSNSTGTLALNQSAEEVPDNVGPGGSEPATHNQVVVDHHPNSTVQDGGWVARIAALLVGEDPTQSYALICGNCHMHNGKSVSVSILLHDLIVLSAFRAMVLTLLLCFLRLFVIQKLVSVFLIAVLTF